MIRFFDYTKRGKKLEYSEHLPKNFSPKKTHLYWIDFEAPIEEEVAYLSSVFNFDPLSVEDSLEKDHHPKIEEFDNYVFMLLRSVTKNQNSGKLITHGVSFFIGSNFLVTVHHDPQAFLEKGMRRVLKNNRLSDESIVHFAHRLFTHHVDNLAPINTILEKKITKLENRILAGDSKNAINAIIEYKRELNNLIGILKTQAMVFEEVVDDEFDFIKEEDYKYFQDIYEEMAHVSASIESNRSKINSVLDLHVSLSTDKLNEIVQVLTIVSGIMLPLTLITGIYGTNFVNIPGLRSQSGFFEMLAMMAIISIALLAFFKYKKWI